MNSEEKNSQGVRQGGDREDSAARPRELNSEAIFAGTKTVTITHDGVRYRLQITRNNKLILQK
jgi:hemin uptake protein HemP